MENKDIIMAERVAAEVGKAGGRTFYVGGFVRDRLLGKENKDVDIEIHGIPVPELKTILDRLGERMEIGESFGVMGLRHYSLDIALPRSETTTGRGHKDFEVFTDPFLGPEKAAMRRDFTMNALMQDVLTGEILDFFGGREDLTAKRIRHVNDRTFQEDPLRVFRAAQFAARFGFTVAEETVTLASSMDVSFLPAERIMGELEKALRKARRPAVFFEVLRQMQQLGDWFPAMDALSDRSFADAMTLLNETARRAESAREPLWLLLSSMCRGCLNGEDPAQSAHTILSYVTNEVKLLRYAENICAMLEPVRQAAMEKDELTLITLYDRCLCPEDLLLLSDACAAAQGKTDAELSGMLRETLALYRERTAAPGVMGRDLLEVGAEPGAAFFPALECAHALQLMGEPREIQMEKALAILEKARREADVGDDGRANKTHEE